MSKPRFKQLLFLNEYPPSTQAGAPVIARQLFRDYDPERLDVLCCDSFYKNLGPVVESSFLPCRHTTIRTFKTRLRPRRYFGRIESTLNTWRLPYIMHVGRRIVRERKVEALFTTSYGAEMPHAAYFLSRELGLPLYYYEMDRLDSVFTCRAAERMIKRHRQDFLRHLTKLWLVSPEMVRQFERLYGVRGEFMHHFVDIDRYQQIAAEAPALPADRLRIVYTGAINSMFLSTMRWFCDWLNRGLELDGRRVELSIYSSYCPPGLTGPHVRYEGFINSDEVPKKLCEAHVAAIFVAFDADRGVREQIETSIYTKTVDYLAAGRPVLVVAPPYAAQIDHFGPACEVVTTLEQAAVLGALRHIVTDEAHRADLIRRGLELARRDHSRDTVGSRFLSYFQTDS